MDEQLKQLIESIRKHPDGSRERRKAMQRLLIKLQQLPGLLKSSHPGYPDALNKTWEWVSQNICTTFEQRTPSIKDSLLKWINGYLKWRIQDLYYQQTWEYISLDVPVGNDETRTTLVDYLSETGLNIPRLSGLDGYIENLQQQKQERLGLAIEAYIIKDPKKRLQNCYPRTNSECDCHLLSQRRFLKEPPDTFEEIARELNMKREQVTNHWYGRCKPLLQEIVQDLKIPENEDL
ncbi:MAG: hypothetical protein HC836_14410 [Richelia sp. RM2_1_2]|nr:hypothetical protein [Richelia sp. SM2_1_7]NJM20050.1 hypothetical protein [Richelia sp. SM1_7_0]NJN09305.1 hypothetical protein [Richelia sp. RM1_1_1]NJO59445.1 hypothetical protein [Richelia sp. RM2_1_2]